ncbi:MAG: SCO family protein [Vulcanimicrobiaceae bacterium]|jgi:protein SCO1/2
MRLGFLAALVALAPFVTCAPASAGGVVPVHGTVLAVDGPRELVVRAAGVTGEMAAGTYRWDVSPRTRLAPGTEIDGLLTGKQLTAVRPAGAFVAGLPGTLVVHHLGPGMQLDDRTLVDQDGTVRHLADWRGKSLVLSFVYTRCPDLQICPAISGKFAYLQHHINPADTHLALVTLDPTFDSPSVLRRYGAQFGADARSWSLLTGEGSEVKALLDAFEVSSLQDGPGQYIHEDDLVLVKPDGTIAEVIPTTEWDPSGVLAEVHALAGKASNPFQRLMLAAVAGIAALCGGYSLAGVITELSAIGITLVGAIVVGVWFTWRFVRHG